MRLRRGSLIVDIMLAIFLLATVGMTLADALPLLYRMHRESEKREHASFAAESAGRAEDLPLTLGEQETRTQVGSDVFVVHTQVVQSEFPKLLEVTKRVADKDGKEVFRRHRLVAKP